MTCRAYELGGEDNSLRATVVCEQDYTVVEVIALIM